MNRNQATYLTMLMGGVYLSYSAYFLSSGFTGVKDFMIAIMILMYLIMGVINVKNLVSCVKLI